MLLTTATCSLIAEPYPGLRHFHEHESAIFFGRNTQIFSLIGMLRDSRFVAVVGPSGCGKSSLVRTGLFPALRQGFGAENKGAWDILTMQPGSDPFEALTDALMASAAFEDVHHNDPERVASERAYVSLKLQRGPRSLLELHRSRWPSDMNLLILVDQFEEVFRFDQGVEAVIRAQNAAFVSLLLHTAAHSSSIHILLTMRSDYLGHCMTFAGLPEQLNRNQYLTPRLTPAQLDDAIRLPARAFGAKVEDELVARLKLELGREHDHLSVLQHVLMRIWHTMVEDLDDDAPAPRLGGEAHDAFTLTEDHYRRVGGVDALSDHGNKLLKKLQPSRSGSDRTRVDWVVSKIFRSLCDHRKTDRDARRPTLLPELIAICTTDAYPEPRTTLLKVLDTFRAPGCDFLSPPLSVPLIDEDTGKPKAITIDVTHESLIRSWSQYQTWITDEADAERKYVTLCETIAAKRNTTFSFDSDLALHYSKWLDKEDPSPAWAARYESLQLPPEKRLAAAKKNLKRIRRRISIMTRKLQLVGGGIVAILIGWFAYSRWRVASLADEKKELTTEKQVLVKSNSKLVQESVSLNSALETERFSKERFEQEKKAYLSSFLRAERDFLNERILLYSTAEESSRLTTLNRIARYPGFSFENPESGLNNVKLVLETIDDSLISNSPRERANASGACGRVVLLATPRLAANEVTTSVEPDLLSSVRSIIADTIASIKSLVERDPSPNVRWAAAETYGNLLKAGLPMFDLSAAPLIQALVSDDHVRVRRAAARGLATASPILTDSERFRLTTAYREATDWKVRESLTTLLAPYLSAISIHALAQHDVWQIREALAIGLGNRETREFDHCDVLATLAQDRNPRVVAAAKKALGQRHCATRGQAVRRINPHGEALS